MGPGPGGRRGDGPAGDRNQVLSSSQTRREAIAGTLQTSAIRHKTDKSGAASTTKHNAKNPVVSVGVQHDQILTKRIDFRRQ